MRKVNYIAILLFVTALFLEIVNIFVSNRVTTSSIHATQLQSQISQLDELNQNLRSQILTYTSFDTIASRAATLGFTESTNSISIDSPLEVAASR